jgi:hypothetical protein
MLGRVMPRYFIFGTDFQIASCLEASGLPGQVHVSQATAALVSQDWGLEPCKELLKLPSGQEMRSFTLQLTEIHEAAVAMIRSVHIRHYDFAKILTCARRKLQHYGQRRSAVQHDGQSSALVGGRLDCTPQLGAQLGAQPDGQLDGQMGMFISRTTQLGISRTTQLGISRTTQLGSQDVYRRIFGKRPIMFHVAVPFSIPQLQGGKTATDRCNNVQNRRKQNIGAATPCQTNDIAGYDILHACSSRSNICFSWLQRLQRQHSTAKHLVIKRHFVLNNSSAFISSHADAGRSCSGGKAAWLFDMISSCATASQNRKVLRIDQTKQLAYSQGSVKHMHRSRYQSLHEPRFSKLLNCHSLRAYLLTKWLPRTRPCTKTATDGTEESTDAVQVADKIVADTIVAAEVADKIVADTIVAAEVAEKIVADTIVAAEVADKIAAGEVAGDIVAGEIVAAKVGNEYHYHLDECGSYCATSGSTSTGVGSLESRRGSFGISLHALSHRRRSVLASSREEDFVYSDRDDLVEPTSKATNNALESPKSEMVQRFLNSSSNYCKSGSFDLGIAKATKDVARTLSALPGKAFVRKKHLMLTPDNMRSLSFDTGSNLQDAITGCGKVHASRERLKVLSEITRGRSAVLTDLIQPHEVCCT